MKKLLFIVAICLIALPMWAKEERHRHSLELTVGDPFPISITGQYYSCGFGPEPIMRENEDGSHTMISASYLGNKWLPTFNLAYHYAAMPWLEVGLRLGYNYLDWGFRMQEITDFPSGERTYKDLPDSEGRMFHHMGYGMASFRFPYFRRPLVQLYSGIAAGVAVDYYSKDHETVGATATKVTPAYQLTALGVRVGSDRIYGLVELGYGHQGLINAGIGVRF